jgi:hypothetical protein
MSGAGRTNAFKGIDPTHPLRHVRFAGVTAGKELAGQIDKCVEGSETSLTGYGYGGSSAQTQARQLAEVKDRLRVEDTK